ncbi:MAG: hypothetical protein LBU77_00295, partial [Clostridiales bacterium]|nr:hypothetical protein [Clostridiales bacterium]
LNTHNVSSLYKAFEPAEARRLAAWTKRRNLERHTMNWQFKTADARVKLKKLYPVLWFIYG